MWADEVTIWSEDFSSYSANDVPSGGTYSYVCEDNGTNKTMIYEASLAGGTSPELLVGKTAGKFTATIPLDNIEGDLTLTFKTNNQKIKAETTTTGITGSLEEKSTSHTLTFKGVTTSTKSIVIVFSAFSSNVRLDNIVLKGNQVSSSPLASIAVDVTGTTTTFHVGDTFTHEGAVVTATYGDASTKVVTDKATFSTPDLSTTGTKEVTVSYTESGVEKTTTYNITVNAPATLTDIALSGTYTTTFTQGDAFNHEGLIVTANYDDGTNKIVTDDATFSTPDMETVGKKTVTVSYTENTVTKTATYDIAVNKAPAVKKYKKVTLQSEIAEGYNYLIVYDTHAFAGVSSGIGSQVGVTVSSDMISNPTNVHPVQLEAADTDGNYYIKDGSDYLLGPNSNGLNTTSDKTDSGTEWTITPDGIANVANTDRSLRYNTSSPRFCNYKTGNTVKDVVLYREVENAVITSAEYATFCGDNVLDFKAVGIKVYTATDNKTSVTLNEIASGKVPANTPVVLYKEGADGTAISVPVIASADAVGDNDLQVSTGTDVENMYVLAMNPTIGFYPWAGTSNLSAGKVYLQGKASYGARAFIGFDDNETTGIIPTAMQPSTEPYYDLQGRRVAQPTKGLYIVNGKKVVIK